MSVMKDYSRDFNETVTIRSTNYDMFFTSEAFREVVRTVGRMPPEQLAMLGANRENDIIEVVYFDNNACRTAGECTPDVETLRKVIAGEWQQRGIRLAGFIHSHPGGFNRLSMGDMVYVERILHAMPETCKGLLLMPIVIVDAKRQMCMINPYIVVLDAETGKAKALSARLFVDGELLEGPQNWSDWDESPEDEKLEEGREHIESLNYEEIDDVIVEEDNSAGKPDCVSTDVSEKYRRVETLLPLEHLAKCTVVSIGCGGARGFIDSLARSGIRRFVLVDKDTVSITNIATQGTFSNETGKNKTAVIAEEIHRIDPDIEVVEVCSFLDDEMGDQILEETVGAELLKNNPGNVLLCGCTDNFPAQDRSVKLALKWGVPYLAGQNYANGLAGEIVFTYPGITEACPHCVLASRYRAYENPEGVKTVTSEGAPIYSTDLLNAHKTHIALMLLTYGTDCRIGKELDLVKDRNLVLFSTSPLCEEELGIKAFGREFAALDEEKRSTLLLGGVVWLKQKPDRPENGFSYCPYCGGTGDLRLVKGMIIDTRAPLNLKRFIDAVQPFTSTGESVLERIDKLIRRVFCRKEKRI